MMELCGRYWSIGLVTAWLLSAACFFSVRAQSSTAPTLQQIVLPASNQTYFLDDARLEWAVSVVNVSATAVLQVSLRQYQNQSFSFNYTVSLVYWCQVPTGCSGTVTWHWAIPSSEVSPSPPAAPFDYYVQCCLMEGSASLGCVQSMSGFQLMRKPPVVLVAVGTSSADGLFFDFGQELAFGVYARPSAVPFLPWPSPTLNISVALLRMSNSSFSYSLDPPLVLHEGGVWSAWGNQVIGPAVADSGGAGSDFYLRACTL